MKTKNTVTTTMYLGALFLILLLLTSGCGDSAVGSNENGGNTTEGNTSVSTMLDNEAFDAMSINITEAKALITEVELETEPSGTSHHIRIEPFVINFNTGGAVVTVTSGNLPGGTFNKIKFKIHKPEDTEPIPDPEFREGTSGSQRYSFIIKGTYNGSNFVYKSRKSMNMVINLASPITTGNGSRNITILVNPVLWFSHNGGVLDPGNPNNADEIDDNIKDSFKRAFKDDDKNGSPDDN